MPWFWVVTQPNKERRVASSIAGLQIRHHLFKIEHQYVLRGSICKRLLCAFPRYIVVSLVDEFGIIRAIDGVTGFITFEGYPRTFPDCEFDKLRWMANDDDVITLEEEDKSRFALGDRVHIDNRTSFAGHDADFQYLLPGGNAVVLIDLMGQKVPISVSERDLFEVVKYRKKYKTRKRHSRRSRGNSHSKLVEPHAKAA